MENEGKYDVAFELIMNAGNAKSKALMAVEAAREFDFEEAEKLLAEASEDMSNAHHSQFEMIQKEAAGESVEVNVLLVHAQDHLTMAMMARDNAEEFINLYKMLYELKEEK